MTVEASFYYYKDLSVIQSDSKTIEQIVEGAIKKRGTEEKCPLLFYQGSFQRYAPNSGYFRQVDQAEIMREVSMILPQINTGSKKKEFKRCATPANVRASVKWLEIKLHEREMDTTTAIAFKNGTLYHQDGRWVLGEHSANNRLTYAIEGEWRDDAECPPIFKEFVRTSYDLKWLDILRAVLAYHADPRYGCKVITMIVGNSGTGKGVTERLIEKMFPKDTIGIITSGFKELNSPEKVAQLVTGKRLIAFPDLQGHQEGLGAVLSLTDGGHLTARRLYSSDTTQFIFTGRVLLCSTQPPAMENAGVGMARRLLILETLGTRLPSDILPTEGSDMEQLLHRELGEIVSWALQMPEDQVRAVLRSEDPAGLLQEARLSIESQMDATRMFIDQCLVPSESTSIPDGDQLFLAYRLFCKHTGHKPCSRTVFVSRMRQALPNLDRARQAIPGSNSTRKTRRIFYGFKLVPELWHEQEEQAMKALIELIPQQKEDQRKIVDPNQAWRDDTSIISGGRSESLGHLVTPLLKEGQFAILKEHRPKEPTYEELITLGVFE